MNPYFLREKFSVEISKLVLLHRKHDFAEISKNLAR